jgi:hypothetical protein
VHAAGDPGLPRSARGHFFRHLGSRKTGRVLGCVLFVAGFSAVFALLGVVLNAVLREAAAEVLAWISRMAGTVIIVLERAWENPKGV